VACWTVWGINRFILTPYLRKKNLQFLETERTYSSTIIPFPLGPCFLSLWQDPYSLSDFIYSLIHSFIHSFFLSFFPIYSAVCVIDEIYNFIITSCLSHSRECYQLSSWITQISSLCPMLRNVLRLQESNVWFEQFRSIWTNKWLRLLSIMGHKYERTEHITDCQNYWVFGLCPPSGIVETRKRNVSETGSVSVLGWSGEDTYSVGSLRKS
jgi:hypothetical protein